GRADPRRLPDRNRQDRGREPGRHRPARARRRGPPPAPPRPPPPPRRAPRALDAPIHASGGIAVLTGSLAPKGGVVKVAGITFDRFEGPARVFDGEDGAMEAILAGSIEPGTVVVIRYEGPKGGPGMREMLAVTGAMKGVGRGADCALVTDGRFSGGT